MWKATGVSWKNGRIVCTRFESSDDSDDDNDEDNDDDNDDSGRDAKQEKKDDNKDHKAGSSNDISCSVAKTKQEKEKIKFEQDLAAVTLTADRVALYYLGLFFVPLVTGFSIFTLLMNKHLSWYSWVLTTLTTCVYTGGFVLMCPQLFINHKLKSVAHLPWKLLCFRFVNTFIDGKNCFRWDIYTYLL